MIRITASYLVLSFVLIFFGFNFNIGAVHWMTDRSHRVNNSIHHVISRLRMISVAQQVIGAQTHTLKAQLLPRLVFHINTEAVGRLIHNQRSYRDWIVSNSFDDFDNCGFDLLGTRSSCKQITGRNHHYCYDNFQLNQ